GNAAIDAAVGGLDSNALNIGMAGADWVPLADGVGVIPLRGGKALAFGRHAELGPTDGGATKVAVFNLRDGVQYDFVAGDATSIGVNDIDCLNVHTVQDALAQLSGLIGCQKASIIGVG